MLGLVKTNCNLRWVECVSTKDNKQLFGTEGVFQKQVDSLENKVQPTFKSLKVLDAVKSTEMGKNVDGSAAGTMNSMEPLKMMGHQALTTVLGVKCMK